MDEMLGLVSVTTVKPKTKVTVGWNELLAQQPDLGKNIISRTSENFGYKYDKRKFDELKEAKLMEKLDHPNIIKFKEVYKTRTDMLHIIMEYADDGDIF